MNHEEPGQSAGDHLKRDKKQCAQLWENYAIPV